MAYNARNSNYLLFLVCQGTPLLAQDLANLTERDVCILLFHQIAVLLAVEHVWSQRPLGRVGVLLLLILATACLPRHLPKKLD
jgi:hypothetical protein